MKNFNPQKVLDSRITAGARLLEIRISLRLRQGNLEKGMGPTISANIKIENGDGAMFFDLAVLCYDILALGNSLISFQKNLVVQKNVFNFKLLKLNNTFPFFLRFRNSLS